MDNLKVAAVGMHSAPGEINENLRRIRLFTIQAAEQGAEIVCFPELSVTGYTLSPSEANAPEYDSDRVIDHLVRIAQEAATILIAGLIEKSAQGGFYISQAIAGPNGVIGIYRKSHLSPPEQSNYRAGQKIDVYSGERTLFGVQLCYEAHFPEISRVMALMGMEVLFVPHASPKGSPEGKLESWLRHLPGRAFDNAIFVVACNQVGKTAAGLSFPGCALVLGPDGRLIAKHAGQGEKILFADLKSSRLEEVRNHRMKYFVPHRRPELYGKVSETSPA